MTWWITDGVSGTGYPWWGSRRQVLHILYPCHKIRLSLQRCNISWLTDECAKMPVTTGNRLAKSQILPVGGVRASVPRNTIITQGRQAITESRGRYRVHNFSKPVTHTQKHRNWCIPAQNVKNMLKFTPITVSLPGNAVLRHNCTQKFHLARNLRIPQVSWTSKLPVTTSHDKCSRSGWPLK